MRVRTMAGLVSVVACTAFGIGSTAVGAHTRSGTEHFVVTPGVDVSVLEERDGWLLVAGADGRRGWLQAESLERVD